MSGIRDIKNLKPDKKSLFLQGYFQIKNKEKYIGNYLNIIFRSSFEKIFFILSDQSPDIIRWNSERIRIQYISPVDNKIHNYYPDVYIEQKQKNGSIKKIIIEIKGKSFLEIPKKPKTNDVKSHKRFMFKLQKYAIIVAKKRACEIYCQKIGAEYLILTDDYFKKFNLRELEKRYGYPITAMNRLASFKQIQ
jgi:hypothetical protein